MEIVDLIGKIFFLIATLGVNVFVITYILNKPWKTSAAGRQLLAFMLSLLIIINASWLFRYWDSHEVIEEWIELFLFFLLAGAIWWFTIGLIRARIKGK